MSLLKQIQKHFPSVDEIVDAKESISIEVKREDTKQGRRKDPENCALARACVRSKAADGAMIGIGFSYLIKNNVATRYKTSSTVAREIVSFDRHHDFAFGQKFLLSKISPSSRLRRRIKQKQGGHSRRGKIVTKTARIRVSAAK